MYPLYEHRQSYPFYLSPLPSSFFGPWIKIRRTDSWRVLQASCRIGRLHRVIWERPCIKFNQMSSSETNSNSSKLEKYFFYIGHCFCCVDKQFLKYFLKWNIRFSTMWGSRVHVISCEDNKHFIITILVEIYLWTDESFFPHSTNECLLCARCW